MKIISIVLFIILILNVKSAFSQNKRYFQQEVNYKINVKLNDTLNILTAFEEIEYINNSPDSLKLIYFHLWPNAYKNNETAFVKQKLESKDTEFFYADSTDRGWIDSLNFKINGKTAKFELLPDSIDIGVLYLNKALKPNNKITITTPFKVKIPHTFSRLGNAKQTFQITQWYPKPAVYDNRGWHKFPYYDIGEFYSEFGNYKVSITLPENYVVGATGKLETQSEIQFLEQKVKETKSKNVFPKHEPIPKSSKKLKTIIYTEKNIHDFAWFADKQFNVIKSSVTLPHTFKKVTTWLMFPNKQANLWLKADEYINDALKYYSLWNGDYPYKNCTAVHSSLSAGGGMEYPTITIISDVSNKRELENVIMHEIGHNWFYGVLGFNERRYPWLDEGINSFNELRYMDTKYPKTTLGQSIGIGNIKAFGFDMPSKYSYYLTYLFTALRNSDQPINTSSNNFSDLNYGAIVYYKTAYAFNFLMNYLGEKQFDSIMQKFYQKWKFKHPYPEDLQAVFEEETGKDLSWFFDDVIGTKKKYDYKISKIKKNKNDSSYTVRIKQNGDFSAPVFYSLIKNDSILNTDTIYFKEKKKDIIINSTNFDKITLDANLNSLDINRNNNSIRRKALLKKANRLKITFLGGIDKPEKTEIYWLPLMGYNNYNKFMTGLLIYSNPFFIKKLEYRFAPMYAWGNNEFAGSGRFIYNILPYKGIFNTIKLKLGADQYSIIENKNWQKYNASINFIFDRKNYRKAVSHNLEISSVYASNSMYLLYGNSPDYNKMNLFINLDWNYANKRIFNPYSLSFRSTIHEYFAKVSAEINYKFSYSAPKTGLDVRLFAGAFLYNNSNLGMYNFTLSGTNGISDYEYNDIFVGRSEDFGNQNFWSQQMTDGNGNFAIYSPLSSNKWLAALNLKTSLWFKSPLRIYANFGTYEGAGKTWDLSQTIAWESGIELVLINNVLSFYFPISYSNDIKITNDYYTNSYLEKVRFKLKLINLNPYEKIRTVETL